MPLVSIVETHVGWNAGRLTWGVQYQVILEVRGVTGCLGCSGLLGSGFHGDIGSNAVGALRLWVDRSVYGLLSWVRGQVAAGCDCLIARRHGCRWFRLWEHLKVQRISYVREDLEPSAVNMSECLLLSRGQSSQPM